MHIYIKYSCMQLIKIYKIIQYVFLSQFKSRQTVYLRIRHLEKMYTNVHLHRNLTECFRDSEHFYGLHLISEVFYVII